MKKIFSIVCMFGIHAIFPIEVWGSECPEGKRCGTPYECCPAGCCLPPVVPPPPHHIHYFNFSTPMKYYLGMLMSLAVLVLTLAWCCRLRQQLAHWGWFRRRQQHSADSDSAGSCYYPPQYSRCGSLCRAAVQPAPPPYNEVTSKPDLYPMVIYLGPDKGDGDLMVQYFKNYIVRPTGSLSATSTIDSLSSSFICNTANEANSIIPPPYSCAGSVDWPPTQRQALLRSVSSVSCQQVPQTTASHLSTCSQPHSVHYPSGARSPSAHNSSHSKSTPKAPLAHSISVPNDRLYATNSQTPKRYSVESNEDVYEGNCDRVNPSGGESSHVRTNDNENYMRNNYKMYPESRTSRVQINKFYTEGSNESNDENLQLSAAIYAYDARQEPNGTKGKIRNDASEDYQTSCAQDHAYNEGDNYNIRESSCDKASAFNLHSLEENNFCSFFSQSIVGGATNENISSDYSNFAKNLNSSVSKDEINRMYSVGGSMTGSDISSLANLGTPDSPPRATSPTSEFKDLVDKIHQLPNDNEDESFHADQTNEEANFANDVKEMRSYFSKSRKNSLYMPLNLTPKNFHPGKISPSSNSGFKRQFSRKSWLSRSAPTTPCGSGFVPNILTFSQRSGASGSGRSSRLSKGDAADGSPLLTELDVSGDEAEQ